MSAALPLDPLLAGLRARAFGMRRGAPRPPRLGAEVELIPTEAHSGLPVPIHADREGGPATLPVLRRIAAERGWTEEPSPYGVPRFVAADGAVISFEPGGQIEVASGTSRSASRLLRALRGTVAALRAAAGDAGIELLSVGIAPTGAPAGIPLQLPGERYRALTEFLEHIGTRGTRMMRQTASFQTNLDWGPDPLATWKTLNAAAPYLVAIFANSPVYGGVPTGWRSFRGQVWRELDGGRTGAAWCRVDPTREYLHFALRAPDIFRRAPWGDYLPFGAWIARDDATTEQWERHLTTLFPEVRPKGWVEVRSPDAVPPEWYAAPLALLAGIAHHPAAAAEAADLLGSPEPWLLDRACHQGLRDARIAAVSRDLFQIGLRGAAALGRRVMTGADVEEARGFYEKYTRRGRSPADDADPLRVDGIVDVPAIEPACAGRV